MTSMWGAPLRDRWRLRRRDPRQARFLTLASLRWVLRNRAYTPWYLVRYWRLLRFRLANPHVVLRGMVFLGKRVELHARPGLRAAGDRPLGAHRRRQRAALPRGLAAHRRQGRVRQGEHDQLLPRHRDRRRHDRRRLGLRHRLRPPHRRRHDPDQGPGHRQVPGADRAGRLDRGQGDGAARVPGRAAARCSARTRWCVATCRTTRSRSARPPGWSATGWPTTRPRRPSAPRWPTSRARPPRPCSAGLRRRSESM